MSDAPPAAPVESLVAGRSRRANAGNLLAKLLTLEADEDDTLFMEDEDDIEFKVMAKDDLSDIQMESSSSEDEGDGGDEEEGEHVLLQQEKEAAKAKKRKTNDMFMKPKPVRERQTKKVTIQEEGGEVESPGAMEVDGEVGGALTRPRKKSERISWVPEFVATRASNRTLSLKNRTQTMQRLEESEKRRLKTIADMERAAARKVKVNPAKEMTQEQRLAEAKITERRNKKSLTSWETMERQKQEEQRQKLLDLQNRRLSGPVITYWSGTAGWDQNGQLIKIGKSLIEELEDEDTKRRRKLRQKAAKDRADKEAAAAAEAKKKKEDVAKPPDAPEAPASEMPTVKLDEPAPEPIPQVGEDSKDAIEIVRSTTPLEPPPLTPRKSLDEKEILVTVDGDADDVKDKENSTPTDAPPPAEPQPEKPEPKPEPELEISARNLIVLDNFDHEQIHDRKSLVRTLWGSQIKQQGMRRPPSPHPLAWLFR